MANGLCKRELPGAGVVARIERIDRERTVLANDPTVNGGAYFSMTVKKHLRAREIAHDNRVPGRHVERVQRPARLRSRPTSLGSCS